MFRVSKRVACWVVNQHRSTQRYADRVVDIEEAKRQRISGDRSRAHPINTVGGVPRAETRGLNGESQAGATAMAGGRTAEARASQEDTSQASRWFCTAASG